MSADQHTFSKYATKSVDLVRSPGGARVEAESEQRGLSSGEVLARGGPNAHRFVREQTTAPAVQRVDHTSEDGAFIELLDAAGVPDAVVNDMRAWAEGGGKAESRDHDAADLAATKAALIKLWGPERAAQNSKHLGELLASLPEDERGLLAHARDSKGRYLLADDAVLVRLAGVARKRAAATGGAGGLNTLEAIAEYRRKNPRAFASDEAARSRERELIDQLTPEERKARFGM